MSMTYREINDAQNERAKQRKAIKTAKVSAPVMEAETTQPMAKEITDVPTVSAAAAETVLTGTTKHAGGRPIVGAEKASKRVSLLMMPSRFAELDAISRQRRTPINALINEAIEAWLSHKQ